MLSPFTIELCVQLLLQRPDVQVASDGHLLVLSLVAVSVDALDATTEAGAAHRREYGANARVLSLAKPAMKLPDGPTRARLNELFYQDNAPGKIVTVIDASGFWAATARGILASISMLTKASRSASTIEEGLALLDFGAADVARLAGDVRAFRDAHHAMIEQQKKR